MALTATQLRSHLYEVLHGIAATGQPVEVELKGKRFIISPSQPTPRRLDALSPHPEAVTGSLEDLAEAPTWDAAAWEQAQP
ncbi:MAG: hypothetical protein HY778_14760 [Betaproteobacteria bacterium]|nr:hypothetical protein [Betaproteobacteria bacterium]